MDNRSDRELAGAGPKASAAKPARGPQAKTPRRRTAGKSAAPARPRISRAESMARTRAAVLEAANGVFTAKGYPGATVDAIAAAAGFTKGAVYTHFPSKQALFLELLSTRLAANEGALRDMLVRAKDYPEKLNAEFSVWLDSRGVGNDTPLLGVELEIEARRSPEVAAAFAKLYDAHVSALGALLAEIYAAEQQQPPMPVNALAATAVALVLGLALGRATGAPAARVEAGDALRALLGLPASHAR